MGIQGAGRLFDSFANDHVTVTAADGTVVRERVAADVQTGMIFINDASVQIAPGYEISRTVPSGLTEVFVVVDPGFYAASHGMEAHYQIKVRRKEATQRPPNVVTYNVTGANAKINIGSYDASHNLVFHPGYADELFASIRSAVDAGITDANQRQSVLDAVAAMEQSAGTPAFLERYTRFVGVVADHITLIAPLIPALTQLIQPQ